jgi:MFS family permease
VKRLRRFLREMRTFPHQFWVLVAGTFVYVGGAALAFPYESIYLNRDLHVSTPVIGAVFGLVPLAMMPFQLVGGTLSDRVGRRPMLILGTMIGVVWFVGFAFVREVWAVALLVAIDVAFGWPLFQTASNAMIADLVGPEKRTEAYTISRGAMNIGVVVGPSAAAVALGFGASFRQLFLAAAAGCAAFTPVALIWMKESRPRGGAAAAPAAAAPPADPPPGDPEGHHPGFGAVLRDRRYLLFCLVAALPVLCIGLFGSVYSLYITGTVGLPFRTWGLLLTMNAAIVAVGQYPVVARLQRRNKYVLLAVSSLLLGLGMGCTALATSIPWLVVAVAVISLGEILLAPVASAIVSDFAPELVRGRYMSVWTVVWNGGASLGLWLGGTALEVLGGRETFVAALIVGLAGAALLPLLRRSTPPQRPRRRPQVVV